MNHLLPLYISLLDRQMLLKKDHITLSSVIFPEKNVKIIFFKV